MTSQRSITYQSICLRGWLACLMIVGTGFDSSVPAIPQSSTAVRSIVTEQGLSLSIEVVGLSYSRDSTITVKYELKSNRNEEIYLVMPEGVSPGYSLSPQRLALSLEIVVFSDHDFEIPKLVRLKPGRRFKGESRLACTFLKSNFRPGQWFLSLSVGYIDKEGMKRLEKLQAESSPRDIARPFQQLQRLLEAGPIEVTLTD